MPRILLVNPPIYDFSAFDFWLKPVGLLRVAGYLRGRAQLQLFDYLDRQHPACRRNGSLGSDAWGRGKFPSSVVSKPAAFLDVPRHFRRYGLPRRCFQELLQNAPPFDFALVQTVMTYWYPGVCEVIQDLRQLAPQTRIVLGGIYSTLCPEHARRLGAGLVIQGDQLDPLWKLLALDPDPLQIPFWEGYPRLEAGVLKLTEGCPFRCTYCSVPRLQPRFSARRQEGEIAALKRIVRLGARNVAFYDDALLFKSREILFPFLKAIRNLDLELNLHTPNALNARFLDIETARAMVKAGFKTFYLGFESSAFGWQRQTGRKVYSEELVRAVDALDRCGVDLEQITAYLIMAHPRSGEQELEASMEFAHALGIRIMLSEFSPIPGTPDGEEARRWVDLDEPLHHNKSRFPLLRLGAERVASLKRRCVELNQRRTRPAPASRQAPGAVWLSAAGN